MHLQIWGKISELDIAIKLFLNINYPIQFWIAFENFIFWKLYCNFFLNLIDFFYVFILPFKILGSGVVSFEVSFEMINLPSTTSSTLLPINILLNTGRFVVGRLSSGWFVVGRLALGRLLRGWVYSSCSEVHININFRSTEWIELIQGIPFK